MMTRRILLTVMTAAAWFLPGHLAILALLVFIWGSAMASTTNSAKTRAVEQRLNAHITATAPAVSLVANGGTIGGALTVSGNTQVNGVHTVTGVTELQSDVHVGGSLYGASGTLTVGDTVNAAGDIDATSGTVHAGGLSAPSGATVTGSLSIGGTSIDNAPVLAGISQAGGMTSGSSGFGGGVWTTAQAAALTTLQDEANSIITALQNMGLV
jgi:hypothetical protein